MWLSEAEKPNLDYFYSFLSGGAPCVDRARVIGHKAFAQVTLWRSCTFQNSRSCLIVRTRSQRIARTSAFLFRTGRRDHRRRRQHRGGAAVTYLRRRLPADAHADIEGVVVGTGADLAVVAQVELGRVGDVGHGREAQHRSVALRRGAEHRERGAGRAGEGRRDRPAGVGIFMQPAQPERQVEVALVAEPNGAGEVGAERRAHRRGGLLRDVEVERLGARFGEAVLGHTQDLQAGERCDRRGGRLIDADPVAGLDLAEELVGPGAAVGGARLQAGDDDLALQLVVEVGVAGQRIDIEVRLREAAIDRHRDAVGPALALEAVDPLGAVAVADADADQEARVDAVVDTGRRAAEVVGERAGIAVALHRAQAAERTHPGRQRARAIAGLDLAG